MGNRLPTGLYRIVTGIRRGTTGIRDSDGHSGVLIIDCAAYVR